MERLTREIKEFAMNAGAVLVGFAGRECFKRIPTVSPDQLFPEAESVVVIACRGMNARVGQYSPTWNAQEHKTGRRNTLLQVLQKTSDFIENKGYECFPVGCNGVFQGAAEAAQKSVKHLSLSSEGEFFGRKKFEKAYWKNYKCVSHMHLAVEAGLGEIGWCRGLVTPQFGPRIILASIITDALLKPDEKIKAPVCKKEECGKCIEYCRSGALSPGYGYNITKCMIRVGELPPVETINRKDEKELSRYFIGQSAGTRVPVLDNENIRTAAGGMCSMCIVACPVGRQRPVKPLATQGRPSVEFNLL
ncbi:MAG: hypothetical protein L3J69_00900 [Desulfobacula sp.]|nr:hypothetical protein [Desulfobacula sp.]